MARSRSYYILHLQLILYSFFFWFNQPVFPYLSQQLGASDIIIGYLNSFNQLFQLVGAFIIGRFMDYRGPKQALIISHLAAASVYFLLFEATSVNLLFLSKIPSILMSAMHASQTFVTLLSSESNRASELGTLSLSYGVGFVVGPFLGGYCSEIVGYFNIAAIAAAGEILVTIGIFFLLDDLKPNKTENSVKDNVKDNDNSNKSLFEAFKLLKLPQIRSVIGIKLFASLAIAIFHGSFSLLARNSGLSASHMGLVLSGVGLLTIGVNTVFIRLVTSFFADASIVKFGLVSLVFSFFLVSFADSVYLLLILVLPITIASTCISTLLTSILTKSTPLSLAGSVLGLDMSIGSGSRVISPILASYLLEFGQFSLGSFTAVCASIASAIAIGIFEWPENTKTVQKKVQDNTSTNSPQSGKLSSQIQPLLNTAPSSGENSKKSN